MSASTERKNRQTARNEGTDRKTLAQRKEDQKKKKEKIKWTVVGAIIVIFFAFVIYLNTGAFYRNLTGLTVEYAASEDLGIEAGSRSFSVAQVNYAYNMQYLNLLNTYGDYTSMIGLDTSTALDEQECTITGEENYTWDDYFMDYAEDYLLELSIMVAYAEANDIELDKDDMAEVEEQMATFDAATDYGYASADKLIAANYGRGTNRNVVQSVLELQQLASKAQQTIAESYDFTQEELEAEYASVKDTYDTFTYSYYYVAAETVADEDGNEAATEETIADAKAIADSIKAKMSKSKLSLADAAAAVVDGAELTEQTDVAGSDLDSELMSWLVDAKRVKGNCAVVEGTSGAYIVEFTSRDNNQHTTDESGDMNYCDYIALNLLRNDALSQWNEDNLSVIEENSSISTSFGIRYVGNN